MPETPPVGTLVMDRGHLRLGEFRGASVSGTRWYLRPLGGGREWEAAPEQVREPTAAEELSAKVAAANRCSARGTA